MMEQIALLCVLAIVGEPLRYLVSRRFTAVRSLDVFQALILDFYLGGFFFYFVALLPFHLFSRYFTILILIISFLILIILLLRKYLRRSENITQNILKKISKISKSRTEVLIGFLLILFFLIVLIMQIEATTGIIFGNIHDASMFSTIATLISRNGMIPATFSPFDSSGIIYPQAFTVIQVFAAYVFDAEPANMILILVPLFQSVAIFAAYFLGKLWSGKTSYGLLFAFLFAFVSRWPKLLTWGSYAFVAAFPLYLVVIGFAGTVIRETGSHAIHKKSKFLFLGLLIGYLGAIHPAFYEVLIATLLVVELVWLVILRRKALGKLSLYLLMFASSLLPVLVFLYRFVVSAGLPGQNVGLPNDIIVPQLASFFDNFKTLFIFFFERDWISPSSDLKIYTILIMMLSMMTLYVARRYCWDNLKTFYIKILLASLLGSGIIVTLVSKELGLSFFVIAISVPETAIIFFASCILLTGIGLATLFEKIYDKFGVNLSKMTQIGTIILLFILLFSPFIYYTFAKEIVYNRWTYEYHSVTTQDDYQLLLNMKNKLPTTSTILINPYDAGGFIPSMAGYKVIYPYSGSRASVSYDYLCKLILDNNLNETAFSLMDQHNITAVFVGSKAYTVTVNNSLVRQEWDPMLFLGNPNFKVIDNVNRSFLFALTFKGSNNLFFEDFENSNLYHNGWTTETARDQKNGTANVTLSSDYRYKFDGNNSLMLATKGSPNASSTIWFYRMFHLPNSEGNAKLSFYLNSPAASQDLSRSNFDLAEENWTQQLLSPAAFPDNEGLSIIISDENWTQQLSITTWERNDTFRLLRAPGLYQIDLSSLWFDNFDSPLPSCFFLKIEEVSFDEQEIVFYLDSINIELATHNARTFQEQAQEVDYDFG